MKMVQSQSGLERLFATGTLAVTDSEHLPAEPPRLQAIPEGLAPELTEHLRSQHPGGLYTHQAEAICAFLGGEDLCLATSTASGKSLIFMACAVNCLLRRDLCKVLALYPVRALIQDQKLKWQTILAPFGRKVGIIDGGVPTEYRDGILRSSDVVLMTPDVLHAWMMSNLRGRAITEFLAALQMLILDEAHVYDGAFGTNVAYLIRRISAAARPYRLILSTATLGEPGAFSRKLTGRETRVFGPAEDGSGRQEMAIHLLRQTDGKPFEGMAALIRALAADPRSRFLAFADSRKLVEQLVAILARDGDGQDDSGDLGASSETEGRVLPYRAGYETQDRHEIQRALSAGELRGVVSTSALELGLDIGEIGTVALLDLPTTAKALWQRIGRAGRRIPGRCLILDHGQKLASTGKSLKAYLDGALEPNWLYLDNRYIRYAHVLCAARECADNGLMEVPEAFEALPEAFGQMLANELNPTESISADLYPMKQRAEAGPHREFPLRTCTEQNFRIEGPNQRPLGQLGFGHAIREAHPGAIYHYMGRPYRVYFFRPRDGMIRVKRERYWTTRPTLQVMTFPRFRGGLLALRSSKQGFLAEAELQVSERVVGFRERRGPTEVEVRYGVDSSYSTRPITRFFQTTGVCWYVPEKAARNESVALAIRDAFALEFGLQARDLGVGLFHSKESPIGTEMCQGACVYDVTHGSLRLTERLAREFKRVLETALSLAEHRRDPETYGRLKVIAASLADMEQQAVTPEEQAQGTDGDWVSVVATGSKVMAHLTSGQCEAEIAGMRYTPQGLMYEVVFPTTRQKRRLVAQEWIQPIYGLSRAARYNLMTGEEENK